MTGHTANQGVTVLQKKKKYDFVTKALRPQSEMAQKCCTEALLEFWPFSSFLPTSKSLQTTKHTMKSLFSSYLHNHHPAFRKKNFLSQTSLILQTLESTQ